MDHSASAASTPPASPGPKIRRSGSLVKFDLLDFRPVTPPASPTPTSAEDDESISALFSRLPPIGTRPHGLTPRLSVPQIRPPPALFADLPPLAAGAPAKPPPAAVHAPAAGGARALNSIDATFSVALDRSLLNLKRVIGRELRTAFRARRPPIDAGLFDRFLDGLLADLSAVVESAGSPPPPNPRAVVRAISAALGEELRPIRRSLRDLSAGARELRERRLRRLQAFALSLAGFRSSRRGVWELALQELEGHRFEEAVARERESARGRAHEGRLLALAAARRDLALRAAHQRAELEAAERLLRQAQDGRAELEGAGPGLRRAALREADAFVAESRAGAPELEGLLRECAAQIADARDRAMQELVEMDAVERSAVARLRSPVRRPPAPHVRARRVAETPQRERTRGGASTA
jgi:hypothetical protein